MSLPRSSSKLGSGLSTARSRRERINSLSTRIILFVFSSTFLTAAVISWLSIGAVFSDNEARVEHRNQALLVERGPKLEKWKAEAETAVLAAAAPGSSWYLEILSARREDGHATLMPVPERLQEIIDRVELRLDTDRGPLLADDPADSCLPIRVDLSEGKLEPYRLEACLSESRLVQILRPPVGDFRGSRLLVVDRSGRVLTAAGVRSSSRIGENLPFTFSAEDVSIGPESLLSYAGSTGIPLVASTRAIGATGWTLVAESSRSHAFAPAASIVKQIVVVDICIILLFTVLAYKITLAIMRPIQALSEGAQRISRGQVDYQIPLSPHNQDELGLLIRTFNDMMVRLRNNQLEIEQDRLRLGEKNEELQHANEILSQLSITDGLTKLHNHRYFQDHLTREIKRVSRTQAPLSLILIDIDDFKLLNDTHGHAAGDEVLVSLASIMNDSARESDLIARYGGEEFVILMPNTDLAGAVHLAEKIRMAVESTRLIIGDTLRPVDLTISVGVALYRGDRREFFSEADRALYQAKAAGKNCVIIANGAKDDAVDPESEDSAAPATDAPAGSA